MNHVFVVFARAVSDSWNWEMKAIRTDRNEAIQLARDFRGSPLSDGCYDWDEVVSTCKVVRMKLEGIKGCRDFYEAIFHVGLRSHFDSWLPALRAQADAVTDEFGLMELEVEHPWMP